MIILSVLVNYAISFWFIKSFIVILYISKIIEIV